MSGNLNDLVRTYWEREPCGTGRTITGELDPRTLEWFEKVEEHRYKVEPFIHSIAQFTRHHGKKILEVGVGAGTDHLQWARAGAVCHGVDLTDAAIETTRARLAAYGFESQLRRQDAETLPFEDGTFDLVYSWGVIHHSENPRKIVAEIHRVLRPGGTFVGMMYGRHSLAAFQVWVRKALLRGRPWRSLADVIWDQVESVGTKAYTVSELKHVFAAFSRFQARPLITMYDKEGWPALVSQFFPDRFGWFVALRGTK